MKLAFNSMVVASLAVAVAFLCSIGCTSTTTYHADGSKSVIKGADPAALAAITATAIAFAPRAKVVQEKAGKPHVIPGGFNPKTRPITAQEIAARYRPLSPANKFAR